MKRVNKQCKYCEKVKPIWEKSLFCSYRCLIDSGEFGLKISLAKSKNKITKSCLVCEDYFKVPQCKKFQKYCSTKCRYKSKEFLNHLSEIHKYKIPWNKNKKCPQSSGNKHWNWKGGISTKNHLIRESLEYKLWRKLVFERDNYICQNCFQKGGILHADHIKPFAYYPNLRFDISNGRTLCLRCHKKTDSYLNNYGRYYKNSRLQTNFC